MAVRYLLLSVAAVLTCLTLNEAPACPTEHTLVAPSTQAFSQDVEDENSSAYIGELAAGVRSYEGSALKAEDGLRTSVETFSTDGEALTDLPDAFSAPDAGELLLGTKAKHFLDVEDESVSTYIRELAAAAASVEIALGAGQENPPTVPRDVTSLLGSSLIVNDDPDPATTGSVPLDPWALHHRRDE
jgi:hypothetical protein